MNKKIIIVFGVSVLLIVTILGIKVYYEEKESESSILTSVDIIDYIEPSFNESYPTSLEEVNSFQKACALAVTPDRINKGVAIEQKSNEIFCFFGKNNIENKDEFIPLRMLAKDVSALYEGQYISIAVNYDNLLEKNNSFTLLEGNFNLCTIIKPVLIEPFREQLSLEDQININRNIVFPEGEIFCSKFFGLPDETLNLLISGFVPSVDIFQAQTYLISEDATVNDIFAQESFINIEKILQSYPLLWDVEKQVI